MAKEYQATRNLGYATMPTCSHDIWRLNRLQRNTPEELKVALTLFLTMPWPPIIYYGEEIGMRNLEEAPYKEGSKSARNRSSCRTPMQWETGLNAGFSSAPSNQIYLPIDPCRQLPQCSLARKRPYFHLELCTHSTRSQKEHTSDWHKRRLESY